MESNDFLPPNSHAVLCTLCLLGKSSNTSALAAAYLLSISIKLLLYQKKLFANLISVFSVALFYGLNQCYCRFHMIITRISYKSELALRHLHPSRWKVYLKKRLFSAYSKIQCPNSKQCFWICQKPLQTLWAHKIFFCFGRFRLQKFVQQIAL